MGKVYRAHDPRTGRDVAVKVSAERFSERFDSEVRAVASLNHPNICTLFDVGPDYLVMEFIEGDAPKGPLPLEEALRIARQIATGLEAAHERGIIHLDLKPANIKVTPGGTVKLLDFGLAKAVEPGAAVSSAASPTLSPTLSMAATQAGMIMGTAAYMAPEQAKGKPVDKRADIWAFGVVLHELLTGERLFEHEDLTETLASVVMTVPKLDGVPVEVRRLLKKCLEKDPRNRLRDIGDVWELLDTPDQSATEGAAQAAGLPHASHAKLWAAAVAVLGVVATVALAGWWRSAQPADRPLVRLDVDLGADVSLPAAVSTFTIAGSSVTISPDGMRLAYVSGIPTKLFTRRLEQTKVTELPGTQDAHAPFFSPDGQWIGFKTGPGQLNKISVEGGAVVPLGEFGGNIFGASWGEDGNILLGVHGKGLVQIRDGGGPAEGVAAQGNGENRLAFPQILPGGKAVLFSAYTASNPDASSIEVITLADHHRKTVPRGGTCPRYLPSFNGVSGHLVYLSKATLFAVPFDLDKLETRGTALPVLDDVASNTLLGAAQLFFSRTGTLVYRRSGGNAGLITVAWLDSAGKTQPLLAKPSLYGRPSLSPDGQRLALSVQEGSGIDIWVYDWQRDTMTRLTFTGNTQAPLWSPDGRYIAFSIAGSGISVTRSDGAGQAQPLVQRKSAQNPWSFSPDGKRLAFLEVDAKTGYDLWAVSIESDGAVLRAGQPEVLLQTTADERCPSFSPDGRWLAYMSAESGTPQIYVRAFPDKGGKWQISNAGGGYPMWSRTALELFFESLDNHILAAAYTVKGDSFVADKPRIWSDKPLGGIVNTGKNFDLAPGGKRIAALMLATEAKGAAEAQNHVVFLINFFDELRRKLPN